MKKIATKQQTAFSRKGGSAKTPKKVASSRANLEAARAKRWPKNKVTK